VRSLTNPVWRIGPSRPDRQASSHRPVFCGASDLHETLQDLAAYLPLRFGVAGLRAADLAYVRWPYGRLWNVA